MDICEFLVLSVINLSLLLWIIKKQGIVSVEGFCAGWLALDVVTDNFQLLYQYWFDRSALPLSGDEFVLRSYPTIVHIIALLVLMAVIFLGNRKPETISRISTPLELDFIAHMGIALLGIGTILA